MFSKFCYNSTWEYALKVSCVLQHFYVRFFSGIVEEFGTCKSVNLDDLDRKGFSNNKKNKKDTIIEANEKIITGKKYVDWCLPIIVDFKKYKKGSCVA